MNARVRHDRFVLTDDPVPTFDRADFRGIGDDSRRAIAAGDGTFVDRGR